MSIFDDFQGTTLKHGFFIIWIVIKLDLKVVDPIVPFFVYVLGDVSRRMARLVLFHGWVVVIIFIKVELIVLGL